MYSGAPARRSSTDNSSTRPSTATRIRSVPVPAVADPPSAIPIELCPTNAAAAIANATTMKIFRRLIELLILHRAGAASGPDSGLVGRGTAGPSADPYRSVHNEHDPRSNVLRPFDSTPAASRAPRTRTGDDRRAGPAAGLINDPGIVTSVSSWRFVTRRRSHRRCRRCWPSRWRIRRVRSVDVVVAAGVLVRAPRGQRRCRRDQ